MKSTFALATISLALLMSSCGGTGQKSSGQTSQDSIMAQSSREELLQAIQERDQLISLMNDIAATTAQIKNMEQIVSINAGNTESGQKQQLSSDLDAIKAELEFRREKIAELESKLSASGSKNSNLLATIETLKNEISTQSSEIEQLRTSLATANEKIAVLDQQVDSLNTQVAAVSQERDDAQRQALEQETLANACYYVVATKQELKDHNIVEGGGFLRKQKVLEGDFDKTFFIQADKRKLTSIPLYAKKAKVLTDLHPQDSYQLAEENGQKVLVITNPDSFWGLSNLLVVQID